MLPKLLPLVKSRYQTLQLVVHEDLTGHLLERLQGYQIDAALLALPLDGDEFEVLPLFDEPFWFACPPCHPLAQLKAVTEADLCGEPMLLLADGHCLRGQALAACGQSGPGRGGDRRFPRRQSGDHLPAGFRGIWLHLVAGLGCARRREAPNPRS